ncbi:hypothetical protein QAD02_007976 [Eretmocerus hayati]|uniref:Uncharacterized protein n=1 Tax=Eretmocerus hayati TaxID=131215 RepID=A0ACC2N5I2_9HYME|nr:hypothetical protein QAD02_007976 [Eretmocerus hayati]
MNQGYVEASSENLLRVDLDMLIMFLQENDCFSCPEVKNVKTVRSMRSSYGDLAVGYVQLLRKEHSCTLAARVCPEHKINSKTYTVVVVVDEESECIEKAECQDCAAPQGGCKHSVALIAWLYRKSQEPPPTSVECYWRKSLLAKVANTFKYTTMESMLSLDASKVQDNVAENDDFLHIDTSAMKRGRDLENGLLCEISKKLQKKYGGSGMRRTGFLMKKQYPVIVASPDGETDNAVVELKCPSKQ